MKRAPLLLTFGLFIHIVLSAGYGLITPIFEPPDEANHYLFVRYLQLQRALPVQTLDRDGPRAHHPPLYFALAALVSAWVPNTGNAERINLQFNPHVWFRYGDPHMDNKAMYLHYTPEERWPFTGQALAVHVMRLVSVLFSTLAVGFTYWAGWELRPGDTAFALFSAGLLAFNTMVVFMAGTVQNSTAALTAGAALLWALSWGYRRGFTLRRWFIVGLVWAIGILLQTSALTLAVCIGLIMAAEARRTRRWRVFFEGGLGVALPVLVLVGWWFWRNYQLYGDFTANSTIAALWTYGPIMPLREALYLIGTGLVGRVGQGLMIDFPAWIYYAAGAVAFMALVGLIRMALSAFRARDALVARVDFWLAPERTLWILHLSAIVVVTLSLFYYMYYYIHGLHGRYLFTVFPSIALLLASGILYWSPRPQRNIVTHLSLVPVLALPVYALFGLLWPTYAPPPAPSTAELQHSTPLSANIGDTAQVLGYNLSTPTVRPGDELNVTVYWLPLSRTDVPYTVFLHLYASEAGSLAQLDTYPGLGNWATTVWDVGRVFVDTYHLRIPPETPALREASLVLGLYNEADPTQLRLPVTGANAGSPDERWVVLGTVTLQP